MPAQQTRRILIKVDTSDSRGLQEIADKMGLLNKNTKSLATNMGFLTSAFQGWLGFLGVRELTRMSDEMQNLSNRLKITAREGEDTAVILGNIARIADRTNQSIGGVGEVYNRMALSLRRVGANSNEVLAVTESLINTFRVAGSTTTETINTIIQLSQAFTSGELRGQELRSVMEQNAVVAELLTKKFGKDIYKQAEKGAIKVVDVLRLLYESQENVAKSAEKLSPTFEQTLTKSMNTVSLKIDELNNKFHLSAGFAKVMEVAVDNLAVVLTLAAGAAIPALIAGIARVGTALAGFAVANPIVAVLTALAAIGAAIYSNWEKIGPLFTKSKIAVLEFAATIEEKFLPLREKLDKFFGFDSSRLEKTRKNIASMRDTAKSLKDELDAQPFKGAGFAIGEKINQDLSFQSIIDKLEKDGGANKVQKIKDILAELNTEFATGRITIKEYNERLVDFDLYKLNREFKEGKFNIFEFNKRLAELRIDGLERQLNAGVLTLGQFNTLVSEVKIDELTAKYDAGKISLIQYNSELVKISEQFLPGSALVAGTSAYIKQVGTLSEGIAKSITQAFSHLEDNLFEFIKTGQFNFSKFAQSILDDLTKIIIRASIVKPLAEGILGGISGFGNTPSYSALPTTVGAPFAKGGVFDGVKKYASGGIVDSPTGFMFGKGQLGVMGEAGPEAILPLKRGAGGELGVSASIVPVQVNIINNAGADLEQRQTTGPSGETVLEVIINQKVRDGISGGKFDKALSTSFGLNRKGS